MARLVEMMACAECGQVGPGNRYHPWLYCQAQKAGWSQESFMANLAATVEFFGGEFDPDATIHHKAGEGL